MFRLVVYEVGDGPYIIRFKRSNYGSLPQSAGEVVGWRSRRGWNGLTLPAWRRWNDIVASSENGEMSLHLHLISALRPVQSNPVLGASMSIL